MLRPPTTTQSKTTLQVNNYATCVDTTIPYRRTTIIFNMTSLTTTATPPLHTETATNTMVVSNTKLITLTQLHTLFLTIGAVEIIHRTPDKTKAHVVFKHQASCHKSLSLHNTLVTPDTSISTDVEGFEPKQIGVAFLVPASTTETKTKTTAPTPPTPTTTTTTTATPASSDSDSDGEYDIGALLFDDPANCHGDPDRPYKYTWPTTGSVLPTTATVPSITVKVPVSIEQGDLMAHWVWESSIKMADLIATGTIPVQGLHVLEVGAGAGLPAIVSAQCGAKHVISTDYPEPTVIDALRDNLQNNTTPEQDTQVMGHSWGTDDVGTMSEHFPTPNIDVVLAADTLWLHDQHEHLFQTLQQCLTHVGSMVYFTYQHHNEHAPSFFTMVEAYSQNQDNDRKYDIKHVSSHGWGGRTIEEFDLNDTEKMGPIFLSTMTRVQ